jgi:3-hydroxypropanoate dehydrogenase
MRLDDKALQQLFLAARTHRAWLPRELPDSVLKELVDLMKTGPTANNGLPARVTFVKSNAAKERLMPHLSEGNRDKTMKASACAIIGHDLAFYAHPPKGQDPLKAFEGKPEAALTYAMRNGSLQGAYFILAARALGLDAGPMSGFDNAGVDKEFFAGTDVKSNFLCNLGYGDPSALRPRGPRFDFDEMARIL